MKVQCVKEHKNRKVSGVSAEPGCWVQDGGKEMEEKRLGEKIKNFGKVRVY